MIIALLSLAASAFLSATLLPGSSEAAFLVYLSYYPSDWLVALVILTIANTLGSMTSFFIGWFIPQEIESKTIDKIRKYGTPILFFSFAPIVGDALPLAAGFLKMPAMRCLFFIALGKFVRYCLILAGFWAVS